MDRQLHQNGNLFRHFRDSVGKIVHFFAIVLFQYLKSDNIFADTLCAKC